jgi:hypothetical protein
MHASAFGRKRHRHAAVREVENSGSHVPPNERFVVTPKALCQLFNTLLDGDPGQDSSPAKKCGWWTLFRPQRGSAALGGQQPCRP